MWEKAEHKNICAGESNEGNRFEDVIAAQVRNLEDKLVDRWANGETLSPAETDIVIGCMNAGMRRRMTEQFADAFAATM